MGKVTLSTVLLGIFLLASLASGDSSNAVCSSNGNCGNEDECGKVQFTGNYENTIVRPNTSKTQARIHLQTWAATNSFVPTTLFCASWPVATTDWSMLLSHC